jgi:hypothetical protein
VVIVHVAINIHVVYGFTIDYGLVRHVLVEYDEAVIEGKILAHFRGDIGNVISIRRKDDEFITEWKNNVLGII